MTIPLAPLDALELAAIEIEQPLVHRVSGDPASRTSWVAVLPAGPLTYRQEERMIEEHHLRAVASETRRALYLWQKRVEGTDLTPYRPPVLREHKFEGDRYGEIADAKVADLDGSPSLWLLIEWSPSTWEKILAHDITRTSVRIVPEYEDDAGETFSPIVRELSITGSPVIKSTGAIQDHLQVRLSDTLITLDLADYTPEDTAKMEEMLQQIASALAGLQESINTLLERDMDDEEVEAMDDDMEAMDDDMEAAEDKEVVAADPEPEPSQVSQVLEDLTSQIQILNARLADDVEGLNLATPPGDRPDSAKPKTEQGWVDLGRAKGLAGKDLVEFVLSNHS